jgi:hypothetical protein
MYPKMTSPNRFVADALDGLAFSRLTWSGLMVAAFGWMLLLSGGSVQVLLSPTAPSVSVIAACTIVSGFGLAILGALQTGFGALTRFFDSVLQRTNARGEAPAVYETPSVPPRSDAALLASAARVEPRRFSPARTEPLVAAPQRAASVRTAPPKQAPTRQAASAKATPRKVLERGWWKDRAYTIFLDGTVEIETLLGLRRFASMADAQDFIG